MTGSPPSRPLVGVLSCNRIVDGRTAQTVATRFVTPLTAIAGATVLIVPAVPDAIDLARLAGLFDALLLTGSCSDLDAARYGGVRFNRCGDAGRDEVALRLAGAMIEAGRPVFGICRGLQELNVLFGGSLADGVGRAGHHGDGGDDDLDTLFADAHDIEIAGDGPLARGLGTGRHRVNSVHHQGIDRLGAGLAVEARAPDGLIEAISARPGDATVIGVQWHPEWDAPANPQSRAFFAMLGDAARGGA